MTFKCEHKQCDGEFPTLEDLERHTLTHCPYRCGYVYDDTGDECVYRFITFADCARHYRVHAYPNKPYKCCYIDENGLDCPNRFKLVKDYNRHHQAHEDGGRFECNYVYEDGQACQCIFPNIQRFIIHRNAHYHRN